MNKSNRKSFSQPIDNRFNEKMTHVVKTNLKGGGNMDRVKKNLETDFLNDEYRKIMNDKTIPVHKVIDFIKHIKPAFIGLTSNEIINMFPDIFAGRPRPFRQLNYDEHKGDGAQLSKVSKVLKKAPKNILNKIKRMLKKKRNIITPTTLLDELKEQYTELKTMNDAFNEYEFPTDLSNLILKYINNVNISDLGDRINDIETQGNEGHTSLSISESQ